APGSGGQGELRGSPALPGLRASGVRRAPAFPIRVRCPEARPVVVAPRPHPPETAPAWDRSGQASAIGARHVENPPPAPTTLRKPREKASNPGTESEP